MPGRSYSAGTQYRYGFNGQEKSDELGEGLTTAQYWEYDSRIGKRWNTDPKANIWESPYSTFGSNPIANYDPNGDELSDKQLVDALKTASNGIKDRINNNQGFYTDNAKKSLARSILEYEEKNKLNLGDFKDFKDAVKGYYNGLGTIAFVSKKSFESVDANIINNKSINNKNTVIASVFFIRKYESQLNSFGRSVLEPVYLVMLAGLFPDVGIGPKGTSSSPLKNCFVAGTKVMTKNGLKNIEEITTKDSVWSCDETTGKVALESVEALSRKIKRSLVRIKVGKETIWCTPEHPFWINKTWVAAKNIKVGDSVYLFAKTKKIVSSVMLKDTIATVYNFTVSKFHTYFVSSLGILVHNQSFEPVGEKVEIGGKQLNKQIKEVASGRGTPQLDANGKQTIFEGRNGKTAWANSFEYNVTVPGQPNQFRILKQPTGVDANGSPTYRFGYTTDHYETIHSFIEKAPAPPK